MKNLKKLLFTGMILSSVLLFISCSSDDDNNSPGTPPSVFGTWKYVGYVENNEYVGDEDECENEFITVNSNNTGTVLLEDCDFGDQSVPFTWEQNSNNSYTLNALGNTRTVFLSFPSGNNIMHIITEGSPDYADVYERQ